MDELNREAVERRLDRLRADYDPPVDVVDEVVPDERFERLRSVAADGYLGPGNAWVVRAPDEAPPLAPSMPDDAGPHDPHVLLILGREQSGPRWSLPGGGREDGETYEAATRREVREETGIEVEIVEPFLLVHVRTTPERGGERVHTLWAYFDARYAGGRLDVQATELRGAAWFTEPPGEMGRLAAGRAAEFWPEYEPPEEAVLPGPVDESEVEGRSAGAGDGSDGTSDSGE